MNWILISGNVVDGLGFHGPFQTDDEAIEWADENLNLDWTLAVLADPND